MLRVLLRRWLVVLIGGAATAALVLGPARGESVVYSRTELAFLAPTSSLYPNALRTNSDAVIMTAGVVARRVGGPGRITKFASPQVTLVGQGIRDGWSLRLPDTGGQWAPNFATQVLVLDVVGPTQVEVERRQAALIAQVERELARLQQGFGVYDVNKISVIVAPEKSAVYGVSGSRVRAAGMTALLGAGGTLGLALALDRWLARPGRTGRGARRQRRSRVAETVA